MSNKFVWGKVIERFDFDFDGVICEVVKYHPKTFTPVVYLPESFYHCEEMSASFRSMFELLVHWLTYKQLGLNEGSLAQGLCRAINL